MSPEQALGGAPPDSASEAYRLASSSTRTETRDMATLQPHLDVLPIALTEENTSGKFRFAILSGSAPLAHACASVCIII